MHSRCIGEDTEIFFKGGGSTLKAKKICGACPVRQQGLELGLERDECFGSPVLAEMIADLEPGDEVTVFNREVVGDDAAAATEEKGATLHSVTESHQPTRTFGYVRTANGSADSQRADIVKTVGAIRIFSDEGVSGTTAGTDRPGQAGDEVVVWQYDRLGRTFEAMQAVVELITTKGATLRSLTESPAEGLFSMKFMMAVAEYEHAGKLKE
ncbi:recombinase family protein [Streptomyces sp. NPDC002671]